MIEYSQFIIDRREDKVNPTLCQKHVEKLIQFTHTFYNINLIVGIYSKYMQRPQIFDLKAIKQTQRYHNSTWDEINFFVKKEKPTVTSYINFDNVRNTKKRWPKIGFIF